MYEKSCRRWRLLLKQSAKLEGQSFEGGTIQSSHYHFNQRVKVSHFLSSGKCEVVKQPIIYGNHYFLNYTT